MNVLRSFGAGAACGRFENSANLPWYAALACGLRDVWGASVEICVCESRCVVAGFTRFTIALERYTFAARPIKARQSKRSALHDGKFVSIKTAAMSCPQTTPCLSAVRLRRRFNKPARDPLTVSTSPCAPLRAWERFWVRAEQRGVSSNSGLAHDDPPRCRRRSALCTLAQSYKQRLPILMKGRIPFAFQFPRVPRLIGNFASNCFSSMKPPSPAGVWFCSARMPAFRISGLAGGAMLEKSFRSLFMRRRLYANHGERGCITYTFQLLVMRGLSIARR